MRTVLIFLIIILSNPVIKGQVCGSYFKESLPLKPGEKYEYIDRFGNEYTEAELRMNEEASTEICTAGHFKIVFDGSVNDADMQTTICNVFNYISTQIGNPYDREVIIGVNFSNLSNNVVAVGSPIFSYFTCGLVDNAVWELFTTEAGTTSNNLGTHGTIILNENYRNNFFSCVNQCTNGINPPTTNYDLYTIVLHEALHVLGVGSLINLNGLYVGRHTRWDTHLYSQTENLNVLDDEPSSLFGCCSVKKVHDDIVIPEGLVSFCSSNPMITVGANNPNLQVNAAYPISLSQITDGELMNILSHLCDPMSPIYFNVNGQVTRELRAEELSILCKLGYQSCVVPNNDCILYAGDDNYTLAPGEDQITISISEVLSNDEFSGGEPNFEILQYCGDYFSDINIQETNTELILSNLPIGYTEICYVIYGCNGECIEGHITIFNPMPCIEDENICEKICNGGFDGITTDLYLSLS